MRVILVLLIALPLATMVSSTTPPRPTWAKDWQAALNYTILATGDSTQGLYVISSSSSAEVVVLADGHLDALCSSSNIAKPGETCVNLSTKTTRWLYHPSPSGEITCCACCKVESSPGCGALSGKWLDNAVYQDQVVFEGTPSYKWLIIGEDPNYYYNTVSGNIPLGLNNSNSELYVWDVASYTTQIDTILLSVPAACDPSVPCPGDCAQL